MKGEQAMVASIGCALAVCGAGLALAARSGVNAWADVPQKFSALDKNHDGYLSRNEVGHMADYDRAFDEADGNQDTRLDPDEFIKAESIYGRLQAANFVNDSVITAKVKAALLKEPELKSLDVSVKTNKGQVLLSGSLDDKQRTKVLQVASSVRGVIGVNDGFAIK
jgi:hypothetical protein